MTIIPLGHGLPHGSSHLPADSVGHVNVCLFGVAPRRDWPFHSAAIARHGIVTVPLILTSRWTGVTRYAALWSPDFPLRNRSGAAIAWLASRAHYRTPFEREAAENRGRTLNSPSTVQVRNQGPSLVFERKWSGSS